MLELTNNIKCKRCRYYEGGAARVGNCTILKKDVSKNAFCSLSNAQINAMNLRMRQMIADMMTGAGEENV